MYKSVMKRHLCIDNVNRQEMNKIIELVKRKNKKFESIIERTLTNNFLYWENYNKEYINNKAVNITAIKFMDVDNDRIYCKEVKDEFGNLYIIMILTVKKKVQKNNKSINSLINKISSYEYEKPQL